MELAINYQPTNYVTSIKLAKGKVSGLSAVLGAAGPNLFCPSFTPPDVGTVTNVRTEKEKFARYFSAMEEIPIGSHGPPKLVSNSALFQGEQPCESARAALALLSALGISRFSRLGIKI